MVAWMISLAPYIPIILDLLGWGFQIFGASASNLKAYQDMIDNVNKQGLLSVESHDRLLAHRNAIIARLNAKENDQNKGTP